MLDLNTLVPANSPLLLLDAAYINDRGEIAGHGVTPNGENHAFLLIPCGEGTDGCEDNAEVSTAATRNNPAPAINRSTISPQARPSPSGIVLRGVPDWHSGGHIPGLGNSN
jgi:hypothetical protein